MNHMRSLVIVFSTSLMLGCVSSKEKIFDQENMLTMKQVYDQQVGANQIVSGNGGVRSVNNRDSDLSGFTREAGREIDVEFPELPNPDLVIYVWPHLTSGGMPVPGYYTKLKMYKSTEYALPGEVGGN